MKEIWRICPIAPEYEVSTLGRIRHKVKKNIRKMQKTGPGYLSIPVWDRTTKKTIRLSVHRLVAITFIPNPLNLPEVNHIDGCKTNNRVDNLEWVTYQDNSCHSIAILGNGRKITDDMVKYIQTHYKPYTKKGEEGSVSALAQKFNVTIATIYAILSNNTVYTNKKVMRDKLTDEDMDYIIAHYTPHSIKPLMKQYGMSVDTFYKWILPKKGLTIKQLKEKYYNMYKRS